MLLSSSLCSVWVPCGEPLAYSIKPKVPELAYMSLLLTCLSGLSCPHLKPHLLPVTTCVLCTSLQAAYSSSCNSLLPLCLLHTLLSFPWMLSPTSHYTVSIFKTQLKNHHFQEVFHAPSTSLISILHVPPLSSFMAPCLSQINSTLKGITCLVH